MANFSFTQNATNASRTAHIGLLGKQITVTQSPGVAGHKRVLRPGGGSDSDIVEAAGFDGDRERLLAAHLLQRQRKRIGRVHLRCQRSATRTGTLTIAGVTLTVTQAGSSYVAANPVTTLVPTGLAAPEGVAVDGRG